MNRIARNGDEVDAYSRKARRWHSWRAGERKRIKRRTHKRERHEGREFARSLDEWA